MTSLIASLGSEKATVAHVAEIIKRQDWEKVYIIAENKPSDFPHKNNIEFIMINPNYTLTELSNEIMNKLKNKINDLEVALNIISGSGKTNMAVLSALLKLGLGIRLVALTREGLKEI